jgi:hypothetical protein
VFARRPCSAKATTSRPGLGDLALLQFQLDDADAQIGPANVGGDDGVMPGEDL